MDLFGRKARVELSNAEAEIYRLNSLLAAHISWVDRAEFKLEIQQGAIDRLRNELEQARTKLAVLEQRVGPRKAAFDGPLIETDEEAEIRYALSNGDISTSEAKAALARAGYE